jgi:hypothetical protein
MIDFYKLLYEKKKQEIELFKLNKISLLMRIKKLKLKVEYLTYFP